MLKDVMKSVYMATCKRQCSTAASLRNDFVYLASFPHNNNGWLDEVVEQIQMDTIYYAYEDRLADEAESFLKQHPQVKPLKINYQLTFFKETLPILAQSKWIVADNYFPFLAALPLNSQQKIVQIWHANGAIKKFGLEDPKNKERSQKDNERFSQVYQRFTDYFVGSKAMGDVFKRSYGATDEMIHYTGMPRTDLLVKQPGILKAAFFAKNPTYKDKKIVLYAPTYRKNPNEEYPFESEWLTDFADVAVIERYHPHSAKQLTPIKGSYEELLAATDVLITDYSSIPFDYTLVRPDGKLLFYQYDLSYFEERFGIQSSFMETVPGPIVQHHEDLLTRLELALASDSTQNEFNQCWNTYNKGQATQSFIQWINQEVQDEG